MQSLSEVASLLGCRDPRRITKCMQIAGIDPETLPQPPQDKRVRLLSDTQVEQIRTAYAHLYGPKHPYTSSADLEARVAELERIVADLQQRLAANLASRLELPAYVPPRPARATTASYTRPLARAHIPVGTMPLNDWARIHHVAIGTVKGWRERRRMPVVRGQWMEGLTRIDYVLDAEGRRVAHQLAGIAWPCDLCTLEEEQEESAETNETPHSAATE